MSDPAPADSSLLTDWLHHQRESAFHSLVRRYRALVHAASLRTSGDDSLAAEATQLTFISLARKAKSLSSRTSIAGWLHLTAVHHSRNLVRKQQREAGKRQNLLKQMEIQTPHSDNESWLRMKPVIDDALAALSDQDREALLLRFYRAMTFPEVAAAQSIAVDAARKRVDRATERMRVLLARRGCTVGGSLASVFLAGFANDAQAALPAVSALASKALAASSTTVSLTTISITTMTQKTTMTITAAILLVGAGSVAFVRYQNSNEKPAMTRSSTSSQHTGSSSSSIVGSGNGPNTVRSKPRRDPAENPELVQKYGESRTILSKSVVTKVIGLLEDTIEMREMAASGELRKSFGGEQGNLQLALGGISNDLKLTPEQQQKAAPLVDEYWKRELEKARASVDSIKKDPAPLMRSFLAGDAYSRGKITEAELKEDRASSISELKGMINPLDQRHLGGEAPLKDPTFNEAFKALLNPDQVEIYESATASAPSATEDPANDGSLSNIPVMELEKLDDTVIAAKKLTGGLKQMMEGMGGLKDLGPMLDPNATTPAPTGDGN